MYKEISADDIYEANEVYGHGFYHIEDSDQALIEQDTTYAIMEASVEINDLKIISDTHSEAIIFDDFEQKVTITRSYHFENFSFPLPSEYGPSDEENQGGQLKDFHHINDADGNLGTVF